MLFNSFAFAIFLPIVFALYWLLPHRFRWPMLLVASYYFYMSWNPKLIVLILMTTAVSYIAAIIIEDAGKSGHKGVFPIKIKSNVVTQSAEGAAHSTQHTAHSTQHTAHSTQHTAHSTQHTAH